MEELLPIDPKAEKRIAEYMDLVKEWSFKINLISKGDLPDIYNKHIVPSVWISQTIEPNQSARIIDIGSGAGFPGMVMQILNPESEVVLIESIRKKALFLKEVAEQLNLSAVVINDRIENFAESAEKTFDTVVCRAVTSIKKMWNWSNKILKSQGSLYLIKGDNEKKETEDLNQADCIIKTIEPSAIWIKKSPNLKHKIIIKMTKR